MRKIQDSQRSINWINRNNPNNENAKNYIQMLCNKRYCIESYEIKPFVNDEKALFIYDNKSSEYYVIRIDLEWIELKALECVDNKVKLLKCFTSDDAWNKSIKFVKGLMDNGE